MNSIIESLKQVVVTNLALSALAFMLIVIAFIWVSMYLEHRKSKSRSLFDPVFDPAALADKIIAEAEVRRKKWNDIHAPRFIYPVIGTPPDKLDVWVRVTGSCRSVSFSVETKGGLMSHETDLADALAVALKDKRQYVSMAFHVPRPSEEESHSPGPAQQTPNLT